MHDIGHVLNYSEFDLIAFVLEESVDHLEQVLFSFGLSNNPGYFVQTLAKGNFDPLNLKLGLLYHFA